MKIDKNFILGSILIFLVIIGFNIYNSPSKEEKIAMQRTQDSLRRVEQERAELLAQKNTKVATPVSNNEASFFDMEENAKDSIQASGDALNKDEKALASDTIINPKAEKIVYLSNRKMKVAISDKGGRIISVELKDFKNYKGEPLILFTGNDSRFNLKMNSRKSVPLNTENLKFEPIVTDDGRQITMRFSPKDGKSIDFIYKISQDDYLVNFNVELHGMESTLHAENLRSLNLQWSEKLPEQEKGRSFEDRYATLSYKYVNSKPDKLSESRDDKEELTEPVKWVAFKDQFFTSVLIANTSFENCQLHSKPLKKDSTFLKSYDSELTFPIEKKGDVLDAGFTFYFGPVQYTLMTKYDKGKSAAEQWDLEGMVSLGWSWLSWINKYFVIPLFNALTSLGWSMGVCILVLTLIVKLIVSPFTFKSFLSSAKMRVLRPQVKEIEDKYPGKDKMMERQKLTMELYRKAGASPMSGCLPMLLQSPILIALFWFFPSAIELRQQSFLWVKDLSTYDSLIHWSYNIPYLGNHISIFCLLMTITNIIYTKFSMESSNNPSGQQMAMMKWMPYVMSGIFFFVFNDYPSGLCYYYFLSTLITIVLTLAFRKFVNEDKLLAKLEANKAKPKKKSGFMARLEEAQRKQEQVARQRAKDNSKRKR